MERMLPIETVALQLGVSTRTVARLVVRGELRAPVRISAGRRGFPESEIAAFISAKVTERDARAD